MLPRLKLENDTDPMQVWSDGLVKVPEHGAGTYEAGFNLWAQGISDETGLPVSRVVRIAQGDEAEPLPDIEVTEEDRIAGTRMLAYAKEHTTRQQAADRKVTLTIAQLDGMIDAFLESKNCTLWGEQWTITDRRGRARAHAFIRTTMLAVIGEEA